MAEALRDKTGKNAQQRFIEIRRFFLSMLQLAGTAREELYFRPKPGEAREPTEEELVWRWAEQKNASVNDISIAIAAAFDAASRRGGKIVTFRECMPFIEVRMRELRERQAAEHWERGR